MLRLPIEDVIQKIKQGTGLSEAEIRDQIKKKEVSLDGLVSEEGAAYIVANELGVALFKATEGSALKIKNILAGMQSVEVVGQVLRTFEPRTWEKGGRHGQVGSFILGDESGTVRVVLWDQRVGWLTDGSLGEGTIVRIKGAYAKENIRGGKEVHVGTRAQLILNPPGVDVKVSKDDVPSIKIADARPGELARIVGTVVQLFSPRFYTVCPQCGRRVTDAEEGSICSQHGTVDPARAMVFSFVLDDGSAFMRCVAFRSNAERLVGLSVEEAQEILDKGDESTLRERAESFLLGKDIEVNGAVRENKAFDRTELLINAVHLNPNPRLLAERALKEK